MTYKQKFRATDELIGSMIKLMSTLDQDTQSKFTGFFSVSAITVYELAIKEIIIDYAEHCHCDYGYFMGNHLSRLNGRIRIEDLKKGVKNLGDRYENRFKNRLEKEKRNIYGKYEKDLCNSYNNLIQCRHSYVHAGNINLTFRECIDDYMIGKHVIKCLYLALK